MDRMLYVAMGGADQAMQQHATIANNMANVATPGFRAQLNLFRAVPVVGDEAPTRTYAVSTTPSADFKPGPITETGRALDVAIRGEGWLVVQTDAGEAYTRAGNLQVGADGQVTTLGGRPVLGDGGPLVVPPGSSVSVAANGLVSALAPGNAMVGITEVGRLKLVNPEPADLERGDDGLFRMRGGLPPAESDPAVQLALGSLEGSNVNAVEAMVQMINISRQVEMHLKALHTADENAQSANKLLSAG